MSFEKGHRDTHLGMLFGMARGNRVNGVRSHSMLREREKFLL